MGGIAIVARDGSGNVRGGAVKLAAMIALGAFLACAACASARTLNLTGTWQANYACEAGWCAGENFPATDVLTQAEGSNVVTGGNGIETIYGTLNGNTLEYKSSTGEGGYTSEGTLQVSANGLEWNGHLVDSNGTSGTYTAKREATTATITGRVVEFRELPVIGVMVQLTGTSDEGKEVTQTVNPAHTGEYEFEVPPGNYTVKATGEASGQNGGKVEVEHSGDVVGCNGSSEGATCKLAHLEAGAKAEANFKYDYCAAEERLTNGKPSTDCPIIFIPGFLGSRIFCGNDELWPNIPVVHFGEMYLEPDGVTDAGSPESCSGQAGPATGQLGIVKSAAGTDIYGKVLEFLNEIMTPSGAPVKPEEGAYAFPYDWRKSPAIATAALNHLVEHVLEETGATHVVLMAHSMGGLVLRNYLLNPDYADKVARAITLGTPYWGAPKAHTPLLASKSNEPKRELFGLDLFLSTENLQISARNMQGLFWLYPAEQYGPWLKVDNYPRSIRTLPQIGPKLSSGQIGPWIESLGGTPALLQKALAGHNEINGWNTNGVPYQVVVGSGMPTITEMEVSVPEFEPRQFVRVWFGAGDATVPERSATQGASEGAVSIAPASVPIAYVCGVEHMALTSNQMVQGLIESYLLRGGEVKTGAPCQATGVETEVDVVSRPEVATGSAVEASARVASAGSTMTLEKAAEEGLVQLIPNGSNMIVVTATEHPVTLLLNGKNVIFKVRPLKGSGRGEASTGPARYYGPLSGSITISSAGTVARDGKPAKTRRLHGAPHTVAHVQRRGRYYIVRLTARDSVPVAATWVRIGKQAARRYTRPLKLTKAQLRSLRFASVDIFGTWEHSERAPMPR